jgi:NAD(P)H-hydrate epimerase
MRVLTAAQMRAVDRRIIEELGLPGLVLMENAALGVVEGLAVARHLLARGTKVQVFLAVPGDHLEGDAAMQLELCRRLGVPLQRAVEEAEIAAFLGTAGACDVVVDALFGTGLTRPLEGGLGRLVDGVNALAVPCLAVDLPSGLDASREEIIGPVIEAAATVTFAAPKIAHVFSPAADRAGTVLVTDLGVPSLFVDDVEGDVVSLLVAGELKSALEVRAADSHKGTYGHVLVVAGSRGKSGAAVLCCRGALRAGAGLVTAAVPDRLVETVDGACIEAMTQGVGPAGSPVLGGAAWEGLSDAVRGKSAVAVGPGLGVAEETCELVRRFVATTGVPLVLDADGLNAFSPEHGGRLEELRERRAPTILTPHPGELGRLLERPSAEVQTNRRDAVREAARRAGAVVVLKGHQTLVAGLNGELSVNPTGNPGMATAGSGDVLTGVLAGLLAQGYAEGVVASLGVFLHGLAGDLAVERSGEESLVADDVLDALPAAFRRLRGDEPPAS